MHFVFIKNDYYLFIFSIRMTSFLCKCTDIVGFYLGNGDYSIIETFIDENSNKYYIFHIHRFNNYKKYIFNYDKIIDDFTTKLDIYNSCISNGIYDFETNITVDDYYIQGPDIRKLPNDVYIYTLTIFIGQEHPLENGITEIIEEEKITLSKTFKEIIMDEFNYDNTILENLMIVIDDSIIIN